MDEDTRRLERAAREGNVQWATPLVDSYGLSYRPGWFGGYKFLRIAVRKNHAHFVEFLLSRGCAMEPKRNVYSPLHYAVKNGNVEIIELLLSRGADANRRDGAGQTPLVLAIEKNNMRITHLLLDHGSDINAKDKNDFTPLHFACKENLEDVVKVLVAKGADVNATSKTKKAETPLHFAVQNRSSDVVNVLILHGAQVDCEDNPGRTVLRTAVRTGDLATVKAVLKGNPDVESNHGCLQEALVKGSFEIIEALVLHGADVNWMDRYRRSALHFAVFDEKVGLTAFEFYDYPHGHEDKCNRNLLKITQLLLNKGANIDAQTNAGVTILHGSIYMELYETAEFLLTQNANVFLEDSQGTTALHIAAYRGHRNITSILLGKGAKVNAKLRNGNTPLHLAVAEERVDITKMLLENGAEVNSAGKDGIAPLHLAENPEIIDILMDFGANIDAIREDGRTALHLRSKQGDEYNVAKLLEHGADINIKSKCSKTALEDTYYYDLGEWQLDNLNDEGMCRTRWILVRHGIKMKALGLFVGESWLSTKCEAKLEKFKTNCQDEVARMKSEFVKGTIATYYDVLREGTNQLAKYMKNENVVLASELGEYRTEFPVYASMIKCQFGKGLRRSKLNEAASEVINRLIRLPEYCTRKIIDYLSSEDLMVLIQV